MAKHTICHIEWQSTDLERTKAFLSGLFEWKFKSLGEDFFLFTPPEGPGGGIEKVEKMQPGRSPQVYIEVDEIEPYLERAKELGGAVAIPKTAGTAHWFAHLTDPDGNIVGLFQGREHE